MRLLNTETLQLESFFGAETDIPPYAILSHTWEKVEIVFQDIQGQEKNELERNPAFAKVEKSCRQARCDGFEYIWIDTCCIDKSSSAELSEAINSMFKWYQQSSLCYVFLNDFNAQPLRSNSSRREKTRHPDDPFSSCRWFKRGWTLQELIAPRRVDFFDKNWNYFGTRDGNLLDRLCTRTRICPEVFTEPRCWCPEAESSGAVRDGLCTKCEYPDTLPQTLDTFAVSTKMNWASSRITTRKEDAAYCLLGLFNINIPMLYGEGDKAFLRIQDAIVRQSKDQSILLWRAVPSRTRRERAMGCLAPGAENFTDSVPIIGRRVFGNNDDMIPMEITDTALKVNIWVCPCVVRSYDPYWRKHRPYNLWLGILYLGPDLARPAILLEQLGPTDQYRRVYHQIIIDTTESPSRLHYSLDGKFHKKVSVMEPTMITIDVYLNEASEMHIGILLQQSQSTTAKSLPYF